MHALLAEHVLMAALLVLFLRVILSIRSMLTFAFPAVLALLLALSELFPKADRLTIKHNWGCLTAALFYVLGDSVQLAIPLAVFNKRGNILANSGCFRAEFSVCLPFSRRTGNKMANRKRGAHICTTTAFSFAEYSVAAYVLTLIKTEELTEDKNVKNVIYINCT